MVERRPAVPGRHRAARRGGRRLQSLSHLNVTVLRAPHDADVIALSRVIRRDGPVAHAEAWLFSHAVVEPMLHATAVVAAFSAASRKP